MLKFRHLITLTIAMLLIIPCVAGAQSLSVFPCVIRGTVTCNGNVVQGAIVVASPGDSDTTNSTGGYGVDALSGTEVTVMATYQGHSQSITVNTTANGGFVDHQDIAIVYSSSASAAASNPTPTPAPSATPVPTPAPSSVTVVVDDRPVTITGNLITVPSGTSLSDIAQNGTIIVPVNVTSTAIESIVLSIVPVNDTAAIVANVQLVGQKQAQLNGANITVGVEADLNGVPMSAGIDVQVLSPDEASMSEISQALSSSGEVVVGTPLAVVDITRINLTDGKDIRNGRLTLTIPRPSDFNASAHYQVVRDDGGVYSVLDADLASGPTADPLVFEVASPDGFSRFILVETAAIVSPSTTMPTAAPASNSENVGIGVYAIAIALITAAGVALYMLVIRKS